MLQVGVIGASGYAGAETLRLCAGHPHMEIAVATGDSQAGTPIVGLYPNLAAAVGDRDFDAYSPELVAGLDVVFLGLPHGASQAMAGEVLDQVKHVVDLSADFRLTDPAVYEEWYATEHGATELLDQFVYGLPELFRSEIVGARAVAAPGCYPTAAALALTPLVRAGVIELEGVIVDAASGVSGAGRPPKPNTTFCAVDEDYVAYGLLDHRHTPEIEQAVGASVLFTPHLAPMNRGILATCYARPSAYTSTAALLDVLMTAYADEPFVVVSEAPPSTKATLGSNAAHLTARFDPRTGTVLVICAIDNLVKGAAGQAIQCANLMTGLDETSGLSALGVYP